MDQADANPDSAQRLAQYRGAEQQLVNAVARIPVSQSFNVYVVRPRVDGGYRQRAGDTAALEVW